MVWLVCMIPGDRYHLVSGVRDVSPGLYVWTDEFRTLNGDSTHSCVRKSRGCAGRGHRSYWCVACLRRIRGRLVLTASWYPLTTCRYHGQGVCRVLFDQCAGHRQICRPRDMPVSNQTGRTTPCRARGGHHQPC
jgi:hypothetical protein